MTQPDTWRVWQCACGNQTKLNYDADESTYHRIKQCICGSHLEWKETVPDAESN